MNMRARALLIVLWVAAPAFAVELKNDGFMAGSQVSYQAGFAAGESGAVALTSPFSSAKVTTVRFLFGGATTMQTVTLTVWEDASGTAPGAVIYSGDVVLTGNDSAMQEVDLSGENVTVSTAFRVGLTFQHAGLPSIAVDTDGLSGSNRNFIQAQGVGWLGAATLGLMGDFVIRAEVVDATDAGVDAGFDAGVDAGTVDAGTDAGLDAGFDAGVADSGVRDAGADAGTAACLSNAECGMGLYCDDATRRCTFDCRAAADCGGGMVCSSLGKCVGDGKPTGCGCTSLPGALAAMLAVVAIVRRRRR